MHDSHIHPFGCYVTKTDGLFSQYMGGPPDPQVEKHCYGIPYIQPTTHAESNSDSTVKCLTWRSCL